MKLSKKDIPLLILICILGFILIYTPRAQNPYPMHVDEWHHIDEAIHISQGNLRYGPSGLQFGFRVFLATLSVFLNLITTYRYFPAIWGVLTALVLFYVVNKKTEKIKNNFLIASFAMIFFFSIKSNANITGLWFFTPLTFVIPLIFLYFYFFTEGIEKKNKKFILTSFLI